MAQYDLLHTLARFLDTHLVFPLLEFTQSRGLYSEDDLLRSKIQLLSRTNMVDYAIDIYKMVNSAGAASDELLERRKEVVARMRELQTDAQPITEFLSDPAKIESLRGEKTHNSSYMQVRGPGLDQEGRGGLEAAGRLERGSSGSGCSNSQQWRVSSA